MSDYIFVTTFSPKGYECYGRDFVDSFIEHVPHELLVYHESQDSVDFHKRLTWVNLDNDPDRRRFLEDYGRDLGAQPVPGIPHGTAVRFCHKVFALTDAVKHVNSKWLVWVDADVIWTKEPDLPQVLEDDFDIVFLGRPRYKHSECGFVGYRVEANPVRRMLEDMRHYYTSGEIFTRPKSDWHDSRCFDICLQRSAIPDLRKHSLSDHVNHDIHVWPNTILSEFSTHQKGPRRKHDRYGHVVD